MSRTAIAATALAALALLLTTPPAEARSVSGVDVSRFNGTINWGKVSRAKIRFAFVQASRGKGQDCTVRASRCGPDELYARNYRRANAHGIRVGAYHRAFVGGDDPTSIVADAKQEAKVFLSEVGEVRSGDLKPALDLEQPFEDLNPSQLRLWTRTWLDRVESATGIAPLIYTNKTSWAATGDTTEFAIAGHPLWVANWDVKAPAVPAANWAGYGWSVWQYSSTGNVRGIEGHVDRNTVRGGLGPLTVD